jgi:hypothetical protein
MPAAIPLAVAGASVVSGAMGAHAAKSAATTQAASADKALALNSRIYDDQKAQMQPFVTGGQQAFQTLLNGWQNRQGMAPGQAMAATRHCVKSAPDRLRQRRARRRVRSSDGRAE